MPAKERLGRDAPESGRVMLTLSFVVRDPKETLTARFDRPLRLARDQNNSVFRAQGRFDALNQPLPQRRHRVAENGEGADDGQIRLHCRR
jgi:hypothetical protein